MENNGEGGTGFIDWGIVLAQVPVLSEHFLSWDKPRGSGWSPIQYVGSPMQYVGSLLIVFQPLSSTPKGIRLRQGLGGLVSVPTSPLPLRSRSSSLLLFLTAPPHRSSLSVWLTGLTQLSSPSARPSLRTLCISPRVHMLWMFSLRLCTIGTSLRASAAGSGPCRSVSSPLLLCCDPYSPPRLQFSSTFSANGSCSSPSSRCSLSSISIRR